MVLNDGPPFGPVIDGTMVVVFWEYRPSNVAAYLFLALFALATLGHVVYLAWLRAWTYIPFILGGIGLIFGYLERARAHSDPTDLDPWLLQSMLLLVAPPLLAATVYMTLGCVAAALLEGVEFRSGRGRDSRGCCSRCCYACCCTCSPTKGFVVADVVAIFTQLIGTVLPASGTPEAQRLSKIIVLVGLLVQLLALVVFIVLCARLHARLRHNPSKSKAMLADPGVNWLGHFVVLEVAAVMLVVRSVVRGAEYLGGTDGFVATHEVFVYVFDAVPMLVVMLSSMLLHPSRLVREIAKLERKEMGEFTELRGASLR
ncbi:RTA1 like protein-domain-containing protein [Lasiosphaeria miniovina]|uniref:RTA1 like protein-domain-containing protein n=1 Tax=Lasiosphaeria miniovina TaxID=1954250 RepID=A0AA40E9P8_9PEZI|nr:RTA1 like protein-domain-containing protein [Lasiosphaeria miniovina]KAK0733549.1 RTA1 like protein-domain-containing protein [Lasiosphaeria miniovina]